MWRWGVVRVKYGGGCGEGDGGGGVMRVRVMCGGGVW